MTAYSSSVSVCITQTKSDNEMEKISSVQQMLLKQY